MAGRVKAGLEVKGLSRLEKEQATGAGILMPVPERQVRLSGGVIPIDDKSEGFPPEFFKGLVPEEINGTEAWRTTLRTDDDSGDMLFYNADGDAFWSVAADAAVWSADWIALLHSLDGKAGNFYDTGQVLRTLSEKQTRYNLMKPMRHPEVARAIAFPSEEATLITNAVLRQAFDQYRAAKKQMEDNMGKKRMLDSIQAHILGYFKGIGHEMSKSQNTQMMAQLRLSVTELIPSAKERDAILELLSPEQEGGAAKK